MPITLKELANHCDAKLVGGDPLALVDSAADITSAYKGQVTQLTNSKYTRYIKESSATACFVAEDCHLDDAPKQLGLLFCKDPEMSFIKAVRLLHPAPTHQSHIAQQAVINDTAILGLDVFVGPFAVIGENSAIGDSTAILPGAYVGNNVTVGVHCRIHPYAVIYDNTVIGDNVTIHSGAIIGADGFGYKFRDNAHQKVPQVGNVVIEDNVEIGANTCIDRGALGNTIIGFGSKIDNLVQIGHNNKVGKHVIMCGLTGVSGSCNIGDYAILAGSSGIADHVNIGQGAVIMARTGVPGDVPAGSHMFGSPAKEKKVAYREQFAISKLPDLIKKVKMLEEEVSLLKLNKTGG
jgi:UDP-3-O-[3-hydroxymyristoyl] glucosamine N-acyltransferase